MCMYNLNRKIVKHLKMIIYLYCRLGLYRFKKTLTAIVIFNKYLTLPVGRTNLNEIISVN